jgi:hypothetical protein
MVFGHNSNLKLGAVTFHIQTEDRGDPHSLIDTTVYYQGRVLHRRTNNYFDLLPIDEDREQALKMRVEEQHRAVIEEIRSGYLQLPIPAATSAMHAAETRSPLPQQLARPIIAPRTLSLELTNAKSWLSGRHAKLLVTVREQTGEAVADAEILVEIEGGAGENSFRTQAGPQGHALIEFDIPRITGSDPALVIYAEHRAAKGHLRFALRSKPRVG